MKAHKRKERTAALLLNPDSGWTGESCSRPGYFRPRERVNGSHWKESGRVQEPLWGLKNLLLLLETKLTVVGRPKRSVVSV